MTVGSFGFAGFNPQKHPVSQNNSALILVIMYEKLIPPIEIYVPTTHPIVTSLSVVDYCIHAFSVADSISHHVTYLRSTVDDGLNYL